MDPQAVRSLLTKNGLIPPDLLTIAVTTKCNLECAHCWFEAGPCQLQQDISGREICKVLDDFSLLGGRKLRLTGGEPLLHPDWQGIFDHAVSLGLEKIILQTNGLLLTEAHLAAFDRVNPELLQIQISLDGARGSTHDLIRGAGTFSQTITLLEELVKQGLGSRLSLFFTEMKHNLQELPEVLSFAAELGIPSVSSGCLVACGRAAADDQIAPPEPGQYLTMLDRYRSDETFRRHYRALGCIASLEWCQSEPAAQGQCSFVRTPYLTADGVLFPCLMCHAEKFSVNAVYEKGLLCALAEGATDWAELQHLSRNRVSALAECQQCPLLKSCAGGCMGRTWGSFGDFMMVEDRCQQRRAIQDWKTLEQE